MAIDKLSSIGQLRLQHQVQLNQTQTQSVSTSVSQQPQSDFATLLNEKLASSDVKFSKHATMRMSQRGVDCSEGLIEDLNGAVEKAREKGAKDIVVIGRDNAFIVNVPNNIVVTTMDSKEMRDNIFTNIDSAVII